MDPGVCSSSVRNDAAAFEACLRWFVIEDADLLLHRSYPLFSDFNQYPRLNPRVFLYDAHPKRDSKLDRWFREQVERNSNEIMYNSRLVTLTSTEQGCCPSHGVTKFTETNVIPIENFSFSCREQGCSVLRS